ncbi:MAG TPA: efflux transporter outer membrane subunit [Sphingomonas sp.]|nr:efflux transporter outer membrane subunit [Sphingomonas sp.]
MFRQRIALLLVVALPVTGCTVGPSYHPAAPAALGVPDSYSVAAPAAPTPADLTSWWSSFNDPLLTRIVEQARANNLDISQAVARLRQAREALVQSRAQLLPTVSGSAGYTHSATLAGGSTTTVVNGQVIGARGASDNLSLGLDVAYQADLFGGVRRSVESSRATYEASGFTYANVLISTEAETARNYVLARLYQAQLANARDSLGVQDDNLEIAGYRLKAGLVSSLDTEQARAQRAQTAATIPTLEQNYNAAVSRLGVLTGQAPGALKDDLAATAPIPTAAGAIPVGIPADTLRQRPDVRAAERSLAAATAQIGVAEAQLYPQLSLSGNLSTNAGTFGNLLNVITGQFFAGLAQSIFNGGRLHAQVRANEAAAEGAFAAYKSTVLTGLEDVENAVVALDAARQREAQFAIAYDAANNTAILSRSQYRAGLTDFITLNTAETSLLSARNGLSQARSDEATATIQLYLALGCGWNAAAGTPQAPAPRPFQPETAAQATPPQEK